MIVRPILKTHNDVIRVYPFSSVHHEIVLYTVLLQWSHLTKNPIITSNPHDEYINQLKNEGMLKLGKEIMRTIGLGVALKSFDL